MAELPPLERFVHNGLGVAAFEQGRMVGFLCCEGPFGNTFRSTDVTGVFAPMGGHAALPCNRARIYAAMYQAAAAKWVRTGAVSHAICLPAHDAAAQQQFFRYGFGLRCIDSIRPMEPIICAPCPGYTFTELTAGELPLVYPLDLALNRHYCESPFLMYRDPSTEASFLAEAAQDEARFFGAWHQGQLCAYLKIAASGETFAAAGPGYRHIHGAYCLPEHRGTGLYAALLSDVIIRLKAESYTRLGVDFESINPAGYGFWMKHFTAYTYGVVRRIDERITQRL